MHIGYLERPGENDGILNAFTVDVEDYFQVGAFKKWVRVEDWERLSPRVERNTRKILALLVRFDVKATFFVLGWVAQRFPRLVREIDAQGHEVACHGYGHESIGALSQRMFRQDLRKAKGILEDLLSKPVVGYRAPNYSMTRECLWAADILLEEGFAYDSSVLPVRYFRKGLPGADPYPHLLRCPSGALLAEFPPSSISVLGLTVPVGGGAYLRHLPFSVIQGGIRRIHKRGKPAVMYVHPWEIDHEQPTIDGVDALTKFRHYRNLHTTEYKLAKLLGAFRFGAIRDLREAISSDEHNPSGKQGE